MIPWYIALPMAWLWVILGVQYGKHLERERQGALMREISDGLKKVTDDLRAEVEAAARKRRDQDGAR